MKIEQIQYVLAIYETGSISKAAERFYLSRPNISNAVRNLESELGFEIMERGAKGVHFTKEGLLLAQKAVQILKEIDEIQEIGNSRSRLRFGIVNPNCPMVEEAFIRLCDRVERDDGLSNYQLSIYREYQYEGMRLLNQKKADLVITVSNNLNAPSMVREMEERGLEYRKLLDVPCNVNLSKDHPLAHDPDFKLEKLKNYPFVEYAIEGDRGSPYNRISQVSFINLSKLFRVSSGNMRTRVIAATNAYSVGIAMPPSWAEEYGLCCIPIPGFTMEFGCIRRAGEPVPPPEKLFMEFLQKEMEFLNETK